MGRISGTVLVAFFLSASVGDWSPIFRATPTAAIAPDATPERSASSYATHFPAAESPISDGGRWVTGRAVGLDWHDVVTTPGRAFGEQSPRTPRYRDPTAILTGSWAPDQSAEGAVFCDAPTTRYYQEVELRLRSTIAPHRNTGYEIFSRCLKTSAGYFSIVRWNGPVGDWTLLFRARGARYGVETGDVIKATVAGSVITGYINDVKVARVVDATYESGNPGIGFNYGAGTTNDDFGFSSFTAWTGASPTPPPSRTP